jgi:hypothetical protein
MLTRQIVLEIGADGGSITLWRENPEDGEQFRLGTSEALFDDEVDRSLLATTSPYVPSLDEALEQLDRRYSWWPELYLVQIGPEYTQKFLAAVKKRKGPRAVARWKERLTQISEHH